MDRELAKGLIPIMIAFSRGEIIEIKDSDGEWYEVNCPNFDLPAENYRIKEKPTHRPFTFEDSDAFEGEWIVVKNAQIKYMIIGMDSEKVFVADTNFTYSELLEKFTFVNGEPCGVKL